MKITRLLSTNSEDDTPAKLHSEVVIPKKTVSSKENSEDDDFVDSNIRDRRSSRQSKQIFKESCVDEDCLDSSVGEKQRSAESILRRRKTKLSYRRQQPEEEDSDSDDSEQDERLAATERRRIKKSAFDERDYSPAKAKVDDSKKKVGAKSRWLLSHSDYGSSHEERHKDGKGYTKSQPSDDSDSDSDASDHALKDGKVIRHRRRQDDLHSSGVGRSCSSHRRGT